MLISGADPAIETIFFADIGVFDDAAEVDIPTGMLNFGLEGGLEEGLDAVGIGYREELGDLLCPRAEAPGYGVRGAHPRVKTLGYGAEAPGYGVRGTHPRVKALGYGAEAPGYGIRCIKNRYHVLLL